jgi:hypothetical protein
VSSSSSKPNNVTFVPCSLMMSGLAVSVSGTT